MCVSEDISLSTVSRMQVRRWLAPLRGYARLILKLLPLAFTLAGCAGGRMTVQGSMLLLESSTSSLAFGNVLDGENSSLTCTLTNNGNSNITISGVTVGGAGFSATGISNGTVLTSGQTVTLTVTFAPTMGGPVSNASVNVASNAANSPLNIGLTGTGMHSVVLTWDEPGPTAGVTYNVFRGTTSGGEGTIPINPSPITSSTYTDTNVSPGMGYSYTVEAVNVAGSSGPSNEVSAAIPTP